MAPLRYVIFKADSIRVVSDQDTMFEMPDLPPGRTGLKYQIWYSAKIEKRRPGIKADLGDDNSISVRIEDHKVKGDIDMNKETLMTYWNAEHTWGYWQWWCYWESEKATVKSN